MLFMLNLNKIYKRNGPGSVVVTVGAGWKYGSSILTAEAKNTQTQITSHIIYESNLLKRPHPIQWLRQHVNKAVINKSYLS